MKLFKKIKLSGMDKLSGSLTIPAGIQRVIKHLSGGGSSARYSTMVVDKDGFIWAAGNNGHYQLGLGHTTKQNSFVKTAMGDVVQAISFGIESTISGFSLAVKKNGSLYGVGSGEHGAFGNNNTGVLTNWTELVSGGVKSIDCGKSKSLYITEDGDLYFAGYSNGVLTSGNTNYLTWTKILTNVDSAVFGGSNIYAIKKDGALWAIGLGSSGQLGNNSNTSSYSFIQCRKVEDGNISLVNNAVQVSASDISVCVRLANGDVYSCGSGAYNKTGLGTSSNINIFTKMYVGSVSPAIDIAMSARGAIILNQARKIYVNGIGANIGSVNSYSVPTLLPFSEQIPKAVSATFDGLLILCENGSIYAGGTGSSNVGVATNPGTSWLLSTIIPVI